MTERGITLDIYDGRPLSVGYAATSPLRARLREEKFYGGEDSLWGEASICKMVKFNILKFDVSKCRFFEKPRAANLAPIEKKGKK